MPMEVVSMKKWLRVPLFVLLIALLLGLLLGLGFLRTAAASHAAELLVSLSSEHCDE